MTILYDPLVATMAASPCGSHLAGSRQVGEGVNPTLDDLIDVMARKACVKSLRP
jgi:hypothetical protein